MSELHITYKHTSFLIDTKNDHYGEAFWRSLEAQQWEPDTLNFLEREIESGTLLLDIGAANGSISLIAAALGARVISYEPNPTVFAVCERNISLNAALQSQITLQLAAVSSLPAEIKFVEGANSKIISEISVGSHSDSATVIPVLSLKDELSRFAKEDIKTLIKMDIEGAEFAILHDRESLEAMKLNRVKLLLAVHPGFYRPISGVRILKELRTKIFILRNFFEAMKLFGELTSFSSISRTNLNPITSKKIFALLITAGYHEFILDFNN